MYMDNCQVADGFAEEVCMLMKDGDVAVRGVKLTKEPNWDRTALVCEKGTGSLKDWEYVPEMGKVKSTSSMFYTINGEAMVAKSTKSSGSSSSGMAKQDICVQKKQKSNDKVCLYKHADNVDIWTMDKRIDFIVKPECPAGFTWEPLRARRCFNPLTLLDCKLDALYLSFAVHQFVAVLAEWCEWHSVRASLIPTRAPLIGNKSSPFHLLFPQ